MLVVLLLAISLLFGLCSQCHPAEKQRWIQYTAFYLCKGPTSRYLVCIIGLFILEIMWRGISSSHSVGEGSKTRRNTPQYCCYGVIGKAKIMLIVLHTRTGIQICNIS
ncbi:hypothetical protein P170DRAFT_25755 [Aspergillus steynii IBT 23096]|uniref:Secreted protein n=1 Tax=Aspergillus steynii IBT 23096 TaxID=1392250 RepID=A0A2I2GPM6_9EURO|nr:uncharacterized protein P170DRAFT_25755 [Aspergillus steynii IBT 23096]PLB54830.1 hypothetical protein P170DRAFT_25755 [Aspergillus steynii IBT 23096]